MTKQTEALKLALDAICGSGDFLFNWHDCEPNNEREMQRYQATLAANEKAFKVIREALAEQPAQHQPVAWRDHVEQRLLTWRQSFVNKSGDQLALDDFMDKRSLDDLIDFVCSEYTSPPASKPWVGLTDEEVMVAAYQAGFDIHEDYENEDDQEAMHWWTPDGEACDDSLLKLRDLIEAKLKEKNT